MTTRRRSAALAVGLLLVLSACSGADGAGDASNDAGAEDALAPDAPHGGGEEAADVDSLEGAADGQAAAGGGGGVDLDVVTEDRHIISAGEIHVRVDDLNGAVRRVEAIVDDAGGLVFSEDTDLRRGARTRITLKVPPSRFRGVLRELAGLGEVQIQSVTTDDVTDQVVDLDSRIATAEASVFRLRALLAEATNVRDIARIEGQLLQRETELEQLRGQRRTIENQVALATITVVLRGERTQPPPPPEPEDPPQKGFLDGLRAGGRSLRTFAVGLSAVAGVLLPWSPLLLAAAFVAWRLLRPRRTSTASA